MVYRILLDDQSYCRHNWKFFSRLTILYDLIHISNYRHKNYELVFFSNEHLSDENIKDLVENGIREVYPIGYEGDNRRLIYMKTIRADNVDDLINTIKAGKTK